MTKLFSRGFIPLQILSRQVLKRSVTGFTLSELLLAMGILAFVLTALLALFLNIMFLNDGNRNLTVAITHAQHIMEEIREAGFTNLDLDTPTELQAHNLAPLLINERIVTVVNNPGDPLDYSVIVRWRDRGLRDRSTELRTLITNY